MEYAFEGDNITMEHGVSSIFTRALVEGLETGAADLDGDGNVSVEELYDYLYNRVRDVTPHQTPTISSVRMQGTVHVAKTGQRQTRRNLGASSLSLHGLLEQVLEEPQTPTRYRMIEARAARSANAVRLVKKAIATVLTDCPRLFTLIGANGDIPDRLPAGEEAQTFSLTLWCEHPSHEHEWPQAHYNVRLSIAQLQDLSAYGVLVGRTIKAALAGRVPESSTNRDVEGLLYEVDRRVTAMIRLFDDQTSIELPESGGMSLSRPQINGGRMVRTLIAEADRQYEYGGLRRVINPSGDLEWICPLHYVDYDPGLPVLNS